MLRIQAISGSADCFASSGIEKNYGSKLQHFTKEIRLSYSKLTYKEIMLSAQEKCSWKRKIESV